MCFVSWYSSGTENATKPIASASSACFSPIATGCGATRAARQPGKVITGALAGSSPAADASLAPRQQSLTRRGGDKERIVLKGGEILII